MTDTDTRNDARQYASSIAHELRTWDKAADGDPDALAAIADERERDRADEAADVTEYINGMALAVETWRGELDASAIRVEIVRTYGGPSCRIEWDSRYPDAFEVVAYWGGSAWRMTVHAPTLGEQISEVYA